MEAENKTISVPKATWQKIRRIAAEENKTIKKVVAELVEKKSKEIEEASAD